MQERYEQAIKETFEYLDDCIAEHLKQDKLTQLLSLGIDKRYVIEKQMRKRGFEVYCSCNFDQSIIDVFPKQHNLPIHIWRNKYVY